MKNKLNQIYDYIKSNQKLCKYFLIAFVCVIFLIPFLINLLLYIPIPSAGQIGAVDWLGFWGSFLGSLIGALTALIALFATYRQQEKHHKDDLENRRYSVMPTISIDILPKYFPNQNSASSVEYQTVDDYSDYEYYFYLTKGTFHPFTIENIQKLQTLKSDETCLFFSFKLSNVGVGPVPYIKFEISHHDSNIKSENSIQGLSVGQTKKYLLICYSSSTSTKEKYLFEITYMDVYLNKYIAKWFFEFNSQTHHLSPCLDIQFIKKENGKIVVDLTSSPK